MHDWVIAVLRCNNHEELPISAMKPGDFIEKNCPRKLTCDEARAILSEKGCSSCCYFSKRYATFIKHNDYSVTDNLKEATKFASFDDATNALKSCSRMADRQTVINHGYWNVIPLSIVEKLPDTKYPISIVFQDKPNEKTKCESCKGLGVFYIEVSKYLDFHLCQDCMEEFILEQAKLFK